MSASPFAFACARTLARSVVDTLTQEFVRLRKDSDAAREAIVLALCKSTFKSKTIIFIKSKADAHRVMLLFGLAGLKAAELHGNLTQAQRLEVPACLPAFAACPSA